MKLVIEVRGFITEEVVGHIDNQAEAISIRQEACERGETAIARIARGFRSYEPTREQMCDRRHLESFAASAPFPLFPTPLIANRSSLPFSVAAPRNRCVPQILSHNGRTQSSKITFQ